MQTGLNPFPSIVMLEKVHDRFQDESEKYASPVKEKRLNVFQALRMLKRS